MNWAMVFNVISSAIVAGLLTGITSMQANPTGSWKSHLAVGVAAALTALANHLRQSPIPPKP